MSPRIRQNTTIKAMSSNTSDSDVWYVGPYFLESGASVLLEGALTTVQTTTITVVAAKNRSTPQLLEVTFAGADAGSLSPGLLVINSTHASRGWLYKLVSGTTWLMSQTASAISISPPELKNCENPQEQDVWTTGDTVTINSTPQINIATAGAVVQGESTSTFANGLVLYNIGVRTPTTTNVFAGITIGAATEFVESTSNYPVYVATPNAGPLVGNGFINSAILGGVLPSYGGPLSNTSIVTGLQASGTCYSAGFFGTGNSYNITPNYGQFTNDVIFAQGHGNLINVSGGILGTAYLDGSTLTVNGSLNLNSSDSFPTLGPFLWGTGTLGVTSNGHVTYPSGAGEAAATFLETGGITLNGQTKACLGVPTVASPTLTCNITASAANADSNLGATLGCLWVEGGGSLCNLAN
jgi:hypothetical protein